MREAWRQLDAPERDEVLLILKKIDDDPIAGVPLLDPLRGFWVYRGEQARVVYRLAPEARTVLVLAVTAGRVEGNA